MIALADKRASSAFVATLREEPSTASLNAAFTHKPTVENVVKVDGLATAIARAEEVIRERVKTGSRSDIFEALVGLTDDASGPALYQPYIPTPIPPRPASTIPPPPILVLNHDVFYHPPAPLPAYAPARPRRNAFGAFAIAFVAPLVVVALVMGWMTYAKSFRHHEETVSTTTTNAAIMPVKLETSTALIAPTPSAKPAEPPMLVVEVKSLKSAPSPRKSRR